MGFSELILRTALTFLILLLLTRLLGKKQMSQMTYFNYVTGIAFGSMAASLMTNPNFSITAAASSLVIWAALTFLVSWLALKSRELRIVFDGEPRVVVKNGKILEEALRKERLNLQEFAMMLRKKNIFSLQNVDYAILEPNGEISVLQKVQFQPASKQDILRNISPPTYYPTQVIMEGKIIKEKLEELKLNEDWLTQQLKQNGIKSPMEVFFAEVKDDGSLYVDKYYDGIMYH